MYNDAPPPYSVDDDVKSKHVIESFTVSAAFNKIISTGAADVMFSESPDKAVIMTAKNEMKAEVVDNELRLTSKPGFVISGHGSNVCISGGTVSGDVSVINGVVYINGAPINRSNQVKEEYDPTCSKVWRILGIPQINRIKVTGSSQLTLCRSIFTKELRCDVSGSGTISIPGNLHFDSINATVTGSGDIDFDETYVNVIECSVTGSGDVSGFLALHKANLDVTGSGDIKGLATKDCKVIKSKTGSGSIKITTLTNLTLNK